ncbi:MAG: T9SS type A sorting domain-containing protein [Bacteroidota bacterium]
MRTRLLLLFTVFYFGYSNAQIVNIPDANFKAKLLSASPSNQIAKNLSNNYFKIDANNNGEIEVSEASQVSYLAVTFALIQSLEGINSFTNINRLDCNGNELTTLTLTNLVHLDRLHCPGNLLTSLTITNAPLLTILWCYSNQLTTLNLTNLNLIDLRIGFNNFTQIDISNQNQLVYFFCNNNNLTSINFSSSNSLSALVCNNNQLTSLDLSNFSNLINLNCNYNLLNYLNIKNGSTESIQLLFSNNSTLEYICADENQITAVQNSVTQYGYTNCHVNGYCSFVPGGLFYTIQGTTKYDMNTNDCDSSDINFTNLKLEFSNGIATGNLITDNSGSYQYEVQSGTHTVTPVLENSSYFIVSPPSSSVTFPATTSPSTNNFCLTANGIHHDLEVAFLPLNSAQPGFDAHYKIVFKNKGTQMQSGSVVLYFDDAILDFISANPANASQSSTSLTWNFTDLQPFETREIFVVLNLNTPMETPPVVDGDHLFYTLSVNGLTDETPSDNTGILYQYVVNSFDPNDKTCLEGPTVAPAMVGKYVHYMIRFENNGTANAQNIVVKDVIDTAKFDIATLLPISGSHSYRTRIINTNQLEFIFQNIQLPFDDANNDGYIVFKIKTKATLVVGDTFSNLANIYFDYNFPIVTNNYVTTIQTLGSNEATASSLISIYPNPVKDLIHFDTPENVFKVEVYDIAGRILSANAVNDNKVNVSDLPTGNYILKVYTESGISSTKIIKE